jgi:AcrR family transcriptional regulator
MLTQEQTVEIRVMARRGVPVKAIARELGCSRNTVRRYLRDATAQRYNGSAACHPEDSAIRRVSRWSRVRIRRGGLVLVHTTSRRELSPCLPVFASVAPPHEFCIEHSESGDQQIESEQFPDRHFRHWQRR